MEKNEWKNGSESKKKLWLFVPQWRQFNFIYNLLCILKNGPFCWIAQTLPISIATIFMKAHKLKALSIGLKNTLFLRLQQISCGKNLDWQESAQSWDLEELIPNYCATQYSLVKTLYNRWKQDTHNYSVYSNPCRDRDHLLTCTDPLATNVINSRVANIKK